MQCPDKGQLILKQNCRAVTFPKKQTKRTQGYYLNFSFVKDVHVVSEK